MLQYYGSAEQIRLQQRAHESIGWMGSTPGACNPGRFLGTDNPSLLGWDFIFKTLGQDGAFGFRLVPAEECADIKSRLAENGYRIDFWDVFVAGAEQIEDACRELADEALPEGLHQMDEGDFRKPEIIRSIQSFMHHNGIAPFHGAMLSGETGPCELIVFADAGNNIAATAYGYFPHNRFSPHALNAWGGLVAVDEAQRGRRLGIRVNALMALSCVRKHGAVRVHELVSQTNETSRRMVQRCGLALDPAVKCGIATRGEGRFTR